MSQNNETSEIIVHYNARRIGYAPSALEANVLAHVPVDPEARHAIYVPHERYGTELGTVLAFYETHDPVGLVRKLIESYGDAISEIEEGGEMHALGTADENASEEEASKED